MKRIVALILVLVMVFALCACGSKEVSSQAQTPSEQSNSTLPTGELESSTPTEEPAQVAQLQVEDFEITEVDKEGRFRFSVKIRNITGADLEEITFYYQVLDANGDILSDQACGAKQIAAGQAIWAGPYKVKIEDSHVDEAVAMRFVTAVGFKTGFPFKEPVTFQLEDYMK